MAECVNCGREANVKEFALRVRRKGIHPLLDLLSPIPLGVLLSKKRTVSLCEECHAFYSRANLFRRLGISVFFVGIIGGAILDSAVGGWGLRVALASIVLGPSLVVVGRFRMAALERRVGF